MSNLFFELKNNKESRIKFSNSEYEFKNIAKFDYSYYSTLVKEKKLFDGYLKKRIDLVEFLEIDDTNYQLKIFDINVSDCGMIKADYINNKYNFYIEEYKNNKAIRQQNFNKKYKCILQNMLSPQMYSLVQNMGYCERENFLYEYKFRYLSMFFDLLETNGNAFVTTFNYCDNISFELIYILSCMFEKVIIYNCFFVYCENFLGNNSTITKEDLLKCIKNNFTVTNKLNFDQFLTYIENGINKNIENLELISNKKYDEYINNKINLIYETIVYKQLPKETLSFFYKKILTNFKRVILEKNLINTNSSIKDEEGKFLSKIITNNKYKNCLEVGLAYGVSSFYILLNEGTNLISIDPFQETQWNNYGVKLLKEFELNKFHQLILDKSYNALPQLLNQYGENSFDLIFIDGWHTFDYTLVDFFYSNLLLRKNGIIVIDDALHKGVNKCVKYIERNYKNYKKIDSPITVAAFKKLGDDNREWNFHSDF